MSKTSQNSENQTCIICREEKPKKDFNDEHVIPDSLNGYYHINLVCKRCNSKMGQNVDTPLINHLFSKFHRYENKIKGKTGKIPNPLEGTFTNSEDKRLQYKTILDKNDEIQIKQLPFVDKEKNENDELTNITIIVDSKDEISLEKIANKIFKRENIDINHVKKYQTRQTISNSAFKGKFSVDLHEFRLGLLKIAYEFTVDKIPEYFDDPLAKIISRILYDADLEALDSLKMTSGFDRRFFEEIQGFFEFENRYFIILMQLKNELVCSIKFLDLFGISIKMSDKPYVSFENSIIGVNDLNKKKFDHYTIFEGLMSNENPSYTRFEYFCKNLKSVLEIKSIGFRYVGEQESNPVVYDAKGKVCIHDFHNFISKIDSDNRIENGNFINYFSFNNHPPLFVKAVKSGNLFQVVGFEIERKIQKI